MTERVKEVLVKAENKLNKSTAIIVGASLAGLMTAISLARAGIYVTVFERSTAKPRRGAVLQVDSGEADISDTAKFLRKIASGGVRSAEAWSSIHSRLTQHATSNQLIQLRYETCIQYAQQDLQSAWIVTDREETFHADILIGADGHRSVIRRYVAPLKPDATFAGYMIWVGMVNENDIPEKNRPPLNAPISMPDGIGDFLLGSVIAGWDGSRDLGCRRLGWAWYDNRRNNLLGVLGCVKENVVQHSLTGCDIPDKILIELKKQALARWPQPWLDATVHCIQNRTITGIPVAEYLPAKLANGRMVLVGDAAHVLTPITAMGFNASLQDAATLADIFSKGIDCNDAAKRLLEYESSRLQIVRQLVQSGQSFSRTFRK